MKSWLNTRGYAIHCQFEKFHLCFFLPTATLGHHLPAKMVFMFFKSLFYVVIAFVDLCCRLPWWPLWRLGGGITISKINQEIWSCSGMGKQTINKLRYSVWTYPFPQIIFRGCFPYSPTPTAWHIVAIWDRAVSVVIFILWNSFPREACLAPSIIGFRQQIKCLPFLKTCWICTCCTTVTRDFCREK